MKCDKCGYDNEKAKALRAMLLELNKKSKEAESEYKISEKFIEIAQGMDVSSKKNFEIYVNMVREKLATELEDLRLRVEIIRKISPESATILDKSINDYENAHRNMFEFLTKTKNNSSWEPDLGDVLKFLGSLIGVTKQVRDMVNVSSYSIRDTMKQIPRSC